MRVLSLIIINFFLVTKVVAEEAETITNHVRRLYWPAPRCITGDFSGSPLLFSDNCGRSCFGNGGCATPEECDEAMRNSTDINSAECPDNSVCIAGDFHMALVGHDPCRALPNIPVMNCFSSMATAQVENKGKTFISDIQVGDKVLTKENQYQTVYTIDHKNPNKKATFVQIYSTVNNGESPLEMTPSHMVFVDGMEKPIPASNVKVGDTLQTVDGLQPIVTKISLVEREGIWNPITADGTIVVDDIVASTYSAVPLHGGVHSGDADKASSLEIAGVNIMSHHDFLHLLMTPYRAMCLTLPTKSLCETTTDHELNRYSQLGTYIVKFSSEQSEFMQDLIILFAVQLALVFQLLSLAMNPLLLILGVTGGTYIAVLRKTKV